MPPGIRTQKNRGSSHKMAANAPNSRTIIPIRPGTICGKDHVKLITRHVWEEYMEVVEDIRHTIGNRQIYQLRKETIERIFGTAKEQHGFRYTQYVGKARMEMKAGLTFACMNLKKLAKILEKRGWNTVRFLLILKKIKRKEVLKEKWCWA